MTTEKKRVSLGPDTLTEVIASVKALDEQLDAARGNVTLLRQSVALDMLKDPTVLEQVNAYLALVEQAAAMEAALNQSVDEAARESIVTAKSSADTLAERRDDVAKKADALRTILVDADMISADDPEYVIPGKRSRSTGGGGGKGVISKNAVYYRIRDGVRKNQSTAQNSPSSLAYYYGKHIPLDQGGTGKPFSIDELRAWAKARGVDVDSAKSWVLELKPGLSIGMEAVTEGDTPEGDTAPAEEDV